MKYSKNVLSFWQEEDYYKKSREGSLETDHPAMQKLFEIAKKVNSMVDLGCGEGSRLNWLINNRKKIKALGVDISPIAIKVAKKQYPNLEFRVEELGENKSRQKFDLVYSAYVLEHLNHPETFIKEALSYLDEDGFLVFIAPNFGAPNRRSPNSLESKIQKLLSGFVKDFDFSKSDPLAWQKVTPLKDTYDNPDDDALSEPYLLSLIRYLKVNNLKVIYSSSLWSIESWSLNPRKSLFKLLGLLNLFPFKYWGPQFIAVFVKQ